MNIERFVWIFKAWKRSCFFYAAGMAVKQHVD